MNRNHHITFAVTGTVLALAATSPALASVDGNQQVQLVDLEQAGSSNRADIEQHRQGQAAIVNQSGTGAKAVVIQLADRAKADVRQSGASRGEVWQSGGADNKVRLDQTASSVATVVQDDGPDFIGMGNNQASLVANGSDFVSVRQIGRDNRSDLVVRGPDQGTPAWYNHWYHQFGSDNEIEVRSDHAVTANSVTIVQGSTFESAGNNRAVASQAGTGGNDLTVHQRSNNNFSSTTQLGSLNSLVVEQGSLMGSDGTVTSRLTSWQQGQGNQVNVGQAGLFNDVGLLQRGDGNRIDVLQRGLDGARQILIDQIGNANVAAVKQNGF